MKPSPEPILLEAICDERECESYLRGYHRHKTRRVTAIDQLSQNAKSTPAIIRDISITGIKIQGSFFVGVGDRLRLDLGRFNIVAEVVHCRSKSERMHVGLKLVHSLTDEELDKFLARRR